MFIFYDIIIVFSKEDGLKNLSCFFDFVVFKVWYRCNLILNMLWVNVCFLIMFWFFIKKIIDVVLVELYFICLLN